MWCRANTEGGTMKRLFRWAFNGAAVSALLFVATCVIWARSYFVAEEFAWSDDSRLVGLRISRGTIRACYCSYYTYPIPNGFFHGSGTLGHETIVFSPYYGDDKEIPLWKITAILLLIAAVHPLRWFEAHVKRAYGEMRRRQLGLCPSCGYDLRATPNRCPECGAMPAGNR
jgi:hypothetical protein